MKRALWFMIAFCAYAANGQEKLKWHNDYFEAVRVADKERKMLVIHVYDKDAPLALNDRAKEAVAKAVLCRISVDYTYKVEGKEVKFLDNRSFSDLQGKAGIILGSYTSDDESKRGFLTATLASLSDRSEVDIGYFLARQLGTFTTAEEVLELVNAERASRGLAPLTLNENACRAAQAHAQRMASSGFGHGQNFSSRVAGDGYQFRSALAENIAQGQGSPQGAMHSWMNSSGHRANILGGYTELGVGYSNGNWVQIFGR